MRWDVVRKYEDRILATTHEIARHGEDKVRAGFKHPNRKLFCGLHGDLGPLRVDLRGPAFPKCAWILRVAHLRTPADGLRHHGRGNTIGRALQETPDKGATNAEPHDHKLVDAQMIH